jgi:hypothetical protein
LGGFGLTYIDVRYFTPQEADAFIPTLKDAFDEIDRERGELMKLGGQLGALGDQFNYNGDGPLDLPEDLAPEVRALRLRVGFLVRKIRAKVDELESHGLRIARIDGQVDFASMRGERPVFLCWRKGEREVRHWHELESGFDSRVPLDNHFHPSLPN